MAESLDQHIWDLGFPHWHDVAGKTSVAGFFQTRKRSGVYVLGFANGERYVGKTGDMVP